MTTPEQLKALAELAEKLKPGTLIEQDDPWIQNAIKCSQAVPALLADIKELQAEVALWRGRAVELREVAESVIEAWNDEDINGALHYLLYVLAQQKEWP